MERALFWYELRGCTPVLGVMAVVLAAYVAMVTVMFDPELAASLDAMMAMMPELFAAFGMACPSATLVDFLVNYLYGFLLELAPLVVGCLVMRHLLAQPLDSGELALIMATPLSRRAVAGVTLGVLAVELVLVVGVVWACEVVCAQQWFAGELDMGALARVNLGWAALAVGVGGACFAGACVGRPSSRGIAVVAALGVLGYLLQMLAGMGKGLEVLRYASVFSLFDPYGLITGEASAFAGAGVLAGAGVVLAAVGAAVWCHRDVAL